MNIAGIRQCRLPHFIILSFPVLCRYCFSYFYFIYLLKIVNLWQLCIEKAYWYHFATQFTEYFKPTSQKLVSKHNCNTNLFFQNITTLWQGTWSFKSSLERHNGINVVFLLANTTSILQPVDQGVILTFESHYLSNR